MKKTPVVLLFLVGWAVCSTAFAQTAQPTQAGVGVLPSGIHIDATAPVGFPFASAGPVFGNVALPSGIHVITPPVYVQPVPVYVPLQPTVGILPLSPAEPLLEVQSQGNEVSGH